MPFTFLLGLGVFAVAILWFVDVKKSRVECRRYLEEEASRVYKLDGSTEVLDIGEEAGMDGRRAVVYETKPAE
jgi:hypothetical protein